MLHSLSVRTPNHVPPLAAVKIVRPRAKGCGRSICDCGFAAESMRLSKERTGLTERSDALGCIVDFEA